ncbi:pyridoxamine 5'-phosphate oxidase family protein [Nocardioides sp. TF02-7]|uniref:pyridoxamine 5'-phosphate oxidase family protein n=1 Tax=Nocardioides sp. TF02-7 TaxID=2917724 RepID=UPI0031F51AC5
MMGRVYGSSTPPPTGYRRAEANRSGALRRCRCRLLASPAMALSNTERQQLLAEPQVATISVAEPGRGPLAVPICYHYEPGGEPWVLTGAGSRKAARIAEAGRFTLLVHRLQPTVRYVSVEGPVSATRPATDDDLRTIAARYLSGEALERYVGFAASDLGAQVVITMRPEHWLSTDMGAW